MATIAVDVGQSGTRSLALDEHGSRHGSAGGYWTDAVASVVLAAVGAVAVPDRHDIGVGLSGYHLLHDDRQSIVDSLAGSGYRGAVTLADDAVTAHLGAFAGGPGVVIAAGTGAVVLCCDGRRATRVDGRGHLLGDRGSGFWIGRAALRDALAEEEAGAERGQESALLLAAREHLAGDLRRVVTAGTPSVEWIAAFARVVAELAGSGNPRARGILAEAAAELAWSATIALRRTGGDAPADACLVGGLAASGPVLTDALAAGLPPGCRLVDARGDALDGTLLLTRGRLDAYGDLVSTFTIDDRGSVVTDGGRS